MEISFPCCKLLSDASDCLSYKSVGILKRGSHGTVDDELSNPPKSIFEYADVQGMEERDASGGDDDNCREEKDDAFTFDHNEAVAVHHVLKKCASFLCHGKVSYSISSSDKEDDHPETALRQLFSEEPVQCPISLPVALVSAMKGAREKQGLPAKKLTVKWHPEVYDPPPTSVSHCISRGAKQQKGRKGKSKDDYKKNGKKGQKGSFPRSKEKKQHMQKVARNKSNRTIDGCSSAGSSGFQMGTTDYCRSSFLKKSVSNMHYPVAEAL